MLRVGGLAALVCFTLLAGCAGEAGSDDKEPEIDEKTFTGIDLEATDETGVIRGVVFDAAIVPLEGVRIVASGAGAQALEAATTPTGAFGFDQLEPGTYFVRASKVGYIAAQASVEVVAGESEPPIQKIMLEADPVTTPFAQSYTFEGFIECSVSVVAVGFAACSTVGALNDRFIIAYTPDRIPHWAQTEMLWDSTQQVNDGLALLYSASKPGQTLLENYAEDRGGSPLLIFANQTLLGTFGVGNGTDLLIRVFNEPIPGTTPPDPVNGDDCLDRPQLGGCATGVGFTIEQDFTHYTHIFYGYVPETNWLFSADGDPVPP